MNYWVAFTSATLVALYGAAIYAAYQAAATARTPQGAVGWGVFLLTLPMLALPLYLFLGHHRFRGYRITRLESRRVAQGLKTFEERNRPESCGSINLAPFENIAHMAAVRGNGADLLINGEATFKAIFAAIDAARTYVLVQFYLVQDDSLGRALKDRLVAASRRGVRVRFMTDALGSYGLPRAYGDDLRAAGIDFTNGERARGHRFRFRLNYRNHRKTVVVDGLIGFIGGHNVADHYKGHHPQLGTWRDTHVCLRGPVVLQLQLIFLEDWHWATDELLLDHLNWDSVPADDDATALIVASGPGDHTETGSMLFFSAITAAQDRFWIASPYFVPDLDIMTALKHAALRGVDVRVLIPDTADHTITWLAAFAYYDEIIACGVRVFHYLPGFSHQKVFVVDDQLAAVGTTNLDNRSFRLNFEAMALFFDQDLAREVAAMLENDLGHCCEITRTIDTQRALIRFGAPVARLFAPIL
jgi:cardiolipin synthase